MENIAISLENVSKTYTILDKISYKDLLFSFLKKKKLCLYKHVEALKNISFTVNKGESVGIIGRNGAGKSTLLGLIAGVIKPTKGSVFVNGRISPLLELGGGFHPDLNAYENIILNGVLMGVPLKKIRKKLHEIIEFAELERYANQPIRTYSSGMLARLGFAIVTQLEPEILLIDEVLAVGDIRFREKCIDLMLNFKKQRVTIILVSHNLEDIKTICDRVIWLENHKIKMDGPTDLVLSKYEEVMHNA